MMPEKYHLSPSRPSTQREGANLRVDFAWGKNTSGVYFTAGEAF
jgi:hypothetical protein